MEKLFVLSGTAIMNQANNCVCADCALRPTIASQNRREEAQRLVGVPGSRCIFARALGHLRVLLHSRERSMNPRLVTDQVARLLLLCCRSNVGERRRDAEFLSDYYQVRGAPLEGVHVLGLDYLYGPNMEVSSSDNSVTRP